MNEQQAEDDEQDRPPDAAGRHQQPAQDQQHANQHRDHTIAYQGRPGAGQQPQCLSQDHPAADLQRVLKH